MIRLCAGCITVVDRLSVLFLTPDLLIRQERRDVEPRHRHRIIGCGADADIVVGALALHLVEGAEQDVEDYELAAIIAVADALVGIVVVAVIVADREDVFPEAQLQVDIGVLENSDGELHENGHHDDFRRRLQQGVGRGKQDSLTHHFHRMYADTIEPIEPLYRMMRCVEAPQEWHFMQRAVKPVAKEIFDQDE